MNWSDLVDVLGTIGVTPLEELVLKGEQGQEIHARILKSPSHSILRLWRSVFPAQGLPISPEILLSKSDNLQWGKLSLNQDGIPRFEIDILLLPKEPPERELLERAIACLSPNLPFEGNNSIIGTTAVTSLDPPENLSDLVRVLQECPDPEISSNLLRGVYREQPHLFWEYMLFITHKCDDNSGLATTLEDQELCTSLDSLLEHPMDDIQRNEEVEDICQKNPPSFWKYILEKAPGDPHLHSMILQELEREAILFLEFVLTKISDEEISNVVMQMCEQEKPRIWLTFLLAKAPDEAEREKLLSETAENNRWLFYEYKTYDCICELNRVPIGESNDLVEELVGILETLELGIEEGKILLSVLQSLQRSEMATLVRDRLELENPEIVQFLFQSQQPMIWSPLPQNLQEFTTLLQSATDEKSQQKICDAVEWYAPGQDYVERYIYQKFGWDFDAEVELYSEIYDMALDAQRAFEAENFDHAEKLITATMAETEIYLEQFPQSITLNKAYSVIINIHANILEKQGQTEQAYEKCAYVLEIYRKLITNSNRTLQSLRDYVDGLKRIGDMLQSVQYHQKALAIQEEIVARSERSIASLCGKALILKKLADIYRQEGNDEKGYRHYSQALEIQLELVTLTDRSLKSLQFQAAILEKIGSICYCRQDYSEAYGRYIQVLAIHRELAMRTECIECLRDNSRILDMLSKIRSKQDRLEEACFYCSQALHLQNQIVLEVANPLHELREKSLLLNKLGELIQSQQKWEEAQQHYCEALTIQEQMVENGNGIVNLSDRYNTLCKLGDLAKKRQKFSNAYDYYKKASEIQDQIVTSTDKAINVLRQKAYLQAKLAKITRNLGDNHQQIEQNYRISIELYREIAKHSNNMAQTLTEIFANASNCIEQHFFDFANDFLDIAWQRWPDLQESYRDGVCTSLAQLATRYLELRTTTVYLGLHKQQTSSMSITTLLEHLEIVRHQHLLNVLAHSPAQEQKVVAYCAEKFHKPQLVSAYQKFIDTRKKLQEQHQLLQTICETQEDIFEQIMALNGQAISEKHKQLTDSYQLNQKLIHNLEQMQVRYQKHLQKCREEIAAIMPNFVPTAPQLNFQDIGNMVQAQEALITVSITERGTLVIVVTNEYCDVAQEGKDFFFIPDFTINDMRNLLSLEDCDSFSGWLPSLVDTEIIREELSSTTQILYRKLFYNVEKSLSERNIQHIVFVVDEHLAVYPMHLMEIEEQSAAEEQTTQYLIEKYSISYAPSFKFLQISRNKVSEPHAAICGFAHAEYDFLYAPLELRNVEQQVTNGKFISGEKAVWSNIAELLSCPGIKHFSCHSKFAHLNPYQSQFYLYQQQVLSLGEIVEQVPLYASSLIVLSGGTLVCDEHPQIGQLGIPSAFLYQGATSVLSCLWTVDDLSTCLLIREYYRHLVNQFNKAEALQCAQKFVREITVGEVLKYIHEWLQKLDETIDYEMMKELRSLQIHYKISGSKKRKPFAHPVFWGGFYLSGEHEKIYINAEES